MNVYTVHFDGYYPVGAVALVTAESVEMAVILLNKKLVSMKLPEIVPADVKQQDTSTRRVDILLDGNY